MFLVKSDPFRSFTGMYFSTLSNSEMSSSLALMAFTRWRTKSEAGFGDNYYRFVASKLVKMVSSLSWY